VSMIFTAPNGATQLANPQFAYVGHVNVLELVQFTSSQFVTYQAGIGEFGQAGIWSVSVQTGNVYTRPLYFRVASS